MYPYKFEYYRFQLVPKKVVQLSIDNVAYTYDEIKAKKNEYFSEVLTKTTFKGKKGNLPYRIVYEKNNIFVLFKSLKLAKSSLATLIWRFSSIPYNA